MAFGHFLLGSHNFIVTALGSCVKWPLDDWDLHGNIVGLCLLWNKSAYYLTRMISSSQDIITLGYCTVADFGIGILHTSVPFHPSNTNTSSRHGCGFFIYDNLD
jgi:hypothetical protein